MNNMPQHKCFNCGKLVNRCLSKTYDHVYCCKLCATLGRIKQEREKKDFKN